MSKIFKNALSRFHLGICAAYPAMTAVNLGRTSAIDEPASRAAGDDCSDGIKIRANKSYDSLDRLTGCLGNMDEEVDNLIVGCKIDLRKYPELKRLVNDFFYANSHLSSFCQSLKTCLEKAQRGETIVDGALHDFEEERRVSGDDGSFRKTLQDLKSFKEYSGDPFLRDFVEQFRNREDELKKMINKLETMLKKLDKKLKRIRLRRRASRMLFVVLAVSLLVGVVVAGIVAAPPVVAVAVGAVSSVPMGAIGLSVSSWWQKSRDTMKRQKRAMSLMERGTDVALKEVMKIEILVNQLEELMESMGRTAEGAAQKRSPVNAAMGEMEKKLSRFRTAVGDLEKETERCGRGVALSRTKVHEEMNDCLSEHPKNTNLDKIFSAW